jgi:hypothetical protein
MAVSKSRLDVRRDGRQSATEESHCPRGASQEEGTAPRGSRQDASVGPPIPMELEQFSIFGSPLSFRIHLPRSHDHGGRSATIDYIS